MPSVSETHDPLAGESCAMPIAICGIGTRLPGGIRSSDALYDFLLNKRDARKAVPADRFNMHAFCEKRGRPGTLAVDQGYWLDDVDLSHFDSSMFSMTPAEIMNLDPHQRILLEVVREAFENAAEGDWRGKNIGCYAATFGEDWSSIRAKDVQDRGFNVYTGYMDLMQSNRISYEYDLRGPSMTLRVGCSGSGLGIHLACQSIRLGECSSAIVAGVNVIMSPETTMLMAQGGTLSPDGSCKTFDASANGYVRAEGASCLYIKRLDHAIRDGNPIRAVIRATSTNADGRTPSLTFPSMDAQEALIRAAYRSACLNDPTQTAMVECHGTGTAVGDAIEAGAVARVFGEKGILMGAVKPNLGHSEGASALTSIIKAVVELENRIILPNIKLQQRNPEIPWEEAHLVVPTRAMEWPKDRLERISINSYGIGGTNVHLVLDSAKSFGVPNGNSTQAEAAPHLTLLLLSAGHTDSLRELQHSHHWYAVDHPDRLDDLAYTLAHRREHLPVRGFCITKGEEEGVTFSPPWTSQSSQKVAFVFTGQGAQWPQMGKELFENFPEVLQDIREMDKILQQQEDRPEWRLVEELLEPAGRSRIAQAEIAQPACTALQIALCNHLRRWNVQPVAVVGHSSGEIGAAYAAGSLSMPEAILLAYYRGSASKEQTIDGAMAAVGLGYDEVVKWLKPGVVIACENSPDSVTLSGDADVITSVLATIEKERPQVFQRRLKVNKAYHSHHMQMIGPLYDRLVANHLRPKPPRAAFFSTVHAEQLHRAQDFGPRYWRQNMESPVWFYQGFKTLLDSDVGNDAIYLEIGPHSALAGPVKQILRAQNSPNTYLSVLSRGSNGAVDFLSCIGDLYSRGAEIRYPVPSKPKALHDLSSYPWRHRDSWWPESRAMKASRFPTSLPHDLLGVRVIESSELEPVWRNMLRLSNVSWLRDHCVGPDIVFPAAGYIAMAGHAVWQITGRQDFTVREVSIKNAMMLEETHPTEIITRLQPHRLTNSLNSDFFEFSIQSHRGSTWTQHCVGLVAAGQASPFTPDLTETSYSRRVEPKRWYRAMSRAGLRYGHHFTGLRDIRASVSSQAALALISDNEPRNSDSSYPLHPVMIDFIMQTSFVAIHRGWPRCMKQASLPVFLQEMYISGGSDNRVIHVNTSVQSQGTVDSYGLGADKAPVFYMRGLELSAMEMADKMQAEHSETAQLVWKPHIDLVDLATLVKPAQENELALANPLIERIFLLCIIDVMEDIDAIRPAHPHLEVYRTWISQQLAQARSDGHPLVPDAKDLFTIPADERKRLIRDMVSNHTEGTMVPASSILFRCYENLADIFKGNIDALDLMQKDGLLGQFYDCLQDKHDYRQFLDLLGHLRPTMNILEVGAGTGGLTAKVLDILRSDSGDDLYREYVFTDISPGFFVGAKERFRNQSRIRYDVLDVSKDPVEQGFPAGHYDLIIASNILHATPYLTETLKNVKALLRPDGRLLLQELCPLSKWTNFVFGLFPGWWLGHDDGRADEPYVSPPEWDSRLHSAGFKGIEASALDADYPCQLNTMLVAKLCTSPTVSTGKRMTLLCASPSNSVVTQLRTYLESEAGFQVDLVCWNGKGTSVPAGQDIVSLLDVEAPFFDNIGEEDLGAFLKTVKCHCASRFLWVTHAVQIRPKDPRFAHVLGMARTLRSELGVSFTTLEMESFGAGSVEAICLLLKHQQRSLGPDQPLTTHSEFDPDQEFAWTADSIHVSRMHWLSLPGALATPYGVKKNGVGEEPVEAALEIGRPGLLTTLRWVPRTATPLSADEVYIKVMSLSMNFKDLLEVMGLIPNTKPGETTGTDCAGIVTAVGCDVTNVSVGDRVMAISIVETSYASRVKVDKRLCTRVPDGYSFDEASTLPIVYLTVLRSLREKAALRQGQSILIHSAAGGVGLAAIHYAKWVGAEIYTTVSSTEKTKFLVEEMGLSKENIFYSRDSTFLGAVMKATGGRGVDVVLNSLSGEQLHASWQCVAEGGIMVEIGKRDLLDRGQLALGPFLANRSYAGVDLLTLSMMEPDWVQEQMLKIVEFCNRGILHPVRPITTFAADKVEEAFRQLQKGQHIGKLAVRFFDPTSSSSLQLPIVPQRRALKLRANRTYLLVGGIRGIGAAVARWMASNGAKHLAFLSRSAGERAEDGALVRELTDMGCQTSVFAGDVTDLATVQRVVSSVAEPIAGVVQLAMVLEDAAVTEMDIVKWNAAVRPKVAGTWNLHEALLSEDLDFFVMASSLSGIFGFYGQSNYASANTFLDAFAQFRHSHGLAASTLDLGVVDEIGFVSRNASIQRQVVRQLSPAISEQSMLDSFHLAILRSCPSSSRGLPPTQQASLEGFRCPNQLLHGVSFMPGIAKGQLIWERDARTALSRVHQQQEEGSIGQENAAKAGYSVLRGFLSAAHDNPGVLDDASSANVVAKEIARQVAIYTMRSQANLEDELNLTLQDFGVDSLVSIELRNWWKQSFGADVTVLQLMNSGSFMDLAQKAINQLKQKHTSR